MLGNQLSCPKRTCAQEDGRAVGGPTAPSGGVQHLGRQDPRWEGEGQVSRLEVGLEGGPQGSCLWALEAGEDKLKDTSLPVHSGFFTNYPSRGTTFVMQG